MVALVLLLLIGIAGPARAGDAVALLYFGADGCPYCAQMEEFLAGLEGRHGDRLVVERFEVSGDPAALERWVAELAVRGREASGVPTVVLGERVWVGFDARVAASIEAAVDAAIEAIETDDPRQEGAPPDAPDAAGDTRVVVPLVGEVDVAARSALAATLLIAFVDGFNPCSLWVLLVLLGMVLNAGASRRRIAAVGATFLAVTGLIYGAFIAGVFTVLGFIEHVGAIRVGVAAVALVVGAVNVKDYLSDRRGFSLSIPARFKPRIYRGGRAIRRAERGLPAVLATTVIMAAGIALVELPCTAGFPVIWSGILRTQDVAGAAFVVLLALYLLVYVIDELVLFGTAVVTLRIGHLEERHGRLLKLLGGAVMLALGVVLLAAPHLMENLLAATLVVMAAVAVAALVHAATSLVGKVGP